MENDIFNGSFLNCNHSNMILDPTFGSFLQSGIPGNNIHRQMFAGNLFVSTVQDTATADVYLTSCEASPFSDTSISRTFTQIGNDSFDRSIANAGVREHFSGTSHSDTSLANLLSSTTCVPENSTREDMIVPSSLAASTHCDFGSPRDINLLASKNDNVGCPWNQSELVGHQVPLGKTFSVVQPSYHVKKSSLPGWNCHNPNWNFCHAYGNSAPAPGSELSLSVGSCQPCLTDTGNIADQCSEISCSAVTQVTSVDSARHSTEFQTSNHANQSSLNDFCLRMAQKEPSLNHSTSCFVQLSHMSSRSNYLHAVQEVLAEFATCALADFNNINDSPDAIDGEAKAYFSSSCSSTPEHPITVSELLVAFGQTETLYNVDSQMCQEANRKKSELLTMLQLVDHSYNHCLEQMQDVMASFVSLIQSSISDRHAHFALHSVSSLYKSLKRRITSLVILIAQQSVAENPKGKENNFESSLLQKQWVLQQLRKNEQQSWRPQRGLPEKSVSILRTWMFENFLHPYPKDNEKHLLAIKSGLTRSQVSNWFINARVRLWKPMIEDMYSELNNKKTDEAFDGESRSENGNLCGPRFRVS